MAPDVKQEGVAVDAERIALDVATMERIADEWSQLSAAGRKFMLSALSSGTHSAGAGADG